MIQVLCHVMPVSGLKMPNTGKYDDNETLSVWTFMSWNVTRADFQLLTALLRWWNRTTATKCYRFL
jgi:hypothetical protein